MRFVVDAIGVVVTSQHDGAVPFVLEAEVEADGEGGDGC